LEGQDGLGRYGLHRHALSTSLHVPSIDLVVAGTWPYNGVHPYMAEGNPESWAKWIAALDKLESLKPRAVIAGHKRPENDDAPRIIEERAATSGLHAANEETATVREFFDRMMKLHGERAIPGSLWAELTAAKAHRGSKSASVLRAGWLISGKYSPKTTLRVSERLLDGDPSISELDAAPARVFVRLTPLRCQRYRVWQSSRRNSMAVFFCDLRQDCVEQRRSGFSFLFCGATESRQSER